jgi:hypothetical protein
MFQNNDEQHGQSERQYEFDTICDATQVRDGREVVAL